jgi:acyl-CoA thioester hydrolase
MAYEQTRRVTAADLDELAHVNNVVYLRWVQDVATAHWNAIAPAAARDALAWVARRHEIDYLISAVEGDDLVLRTWVGEARGLTFERFTEIVKAATGQVAARARTLWVPVDRESGRPTRVSGEIRGLFSSPAAREEARSDA